MQELQGLACERCFLLELFQFPSREDRRDDEQQALAPFVHRKGGNLDPTPDTVD